MNPATHRKVLITIVCIELLGLLCGCGRSSNQAAARTFANDAPVSVKFQWGDRFALVPEKAVAKNKATGETILEAKLKELDGSHKPGLKAIIEVVALKAETNLFKAELTYLVGPNRDGRLLQAVIDGKWISEYSYVESLFPVITTKDRSSGLILSKTSDAKVDSKKSGEKKINSETIRRARRMDRLGMIGGSILGEILEQHWPATDENATFTSIETCYDDKGNVVYSGRTWRNAGTGLLVDEIVEKGALPNDYHHFEFLFLEWPFR
ncbi:MAG: hypothetical protein HY043_18570 [Verrucomicrobia bacterium]|nr:hypothetical protein [Verrucomicrobiota bacterium]